MSINKFNDAGKTTLADGTTIDASNAGGGGNSTFATPVGTSPVKRINPALAHPVSDVAWYEWAAQTATAAYLTLTGGGFSGAIGGAMASWIMITGLPTSNIQFVRFGASGNNYVGLTTAGKLNIAQAGTQVYVSTATLALNTPYWVCHAIFTHATTGVNRLGLYDRYGKLIESTNTTAGNTSQTINANSSVGKLTAAGNMAIYRATGMRVSTDSNLLIPPPVSPGVRGWGLAA